MGGTITLSQRRRYWNKRYRLEGKIWGQKPCWVMEEAVQVFRSRKHAQRILVPGCGYGRHVSYLAEVGFEVTGVDFSKKALEIGKQSSLSNPSVNYVVADICKIPLPEHFFDGIFAYNILHLLLRRERLSCMKELRRVLAPNGVIVIVAMSVKDKAFGNGMKIEKNTFDTDHKGKPIHFFSRKELLGLSQGFKINKIDDIEVFESHSGKAHTHCSIRVILEG